MNLNLYHARYQGFITAWSWEAYFKSFELCNNYSLYISYKQLREQPWNWLTQYSSSTQEYLFTYLIRVSTGISGYGLRAEIIRKFVPFLLWKRFRNSETIFFVNQKFPGISKGFGNFWNVPEYRFRKNRSEISRTNCTRITLKPLKLM